MPALEGHTWWHSITDGLNHLYPSAIGPDHEGVITAACDKVVMGFRVAREEYGSYCSDCMVKLGHVTADHLDRRRGELAQRFLDDSGR